MTLRGQNAISWEEFMEYLSTNEEWAEEEEWATYLEELQTLHLHPININTATQKQLEALPFLTPKQAEQIVQHIQSHDGMHSLAELILIPSLTYQERRFLSLFLYAAEDPEEEEKPLLLNSRTTHHECATRLDIPLYHRRGYLIDKGYRGSPIYNKVYYRMTSGKHLSAGLRAERDAGERGIDSYGAYIMLKDIALSRSRNQGSPRRANGQDSIVQASTPSLYLQSFVVGDFKASFGQGLVLNQGFGRSKISTVLRSSQGFRAHRSTDEFNYLHGLGTSISLQDFTLSAFYSHRNWDATLNGSKESGERIEGIESGEREESTVKTIVKDGYHRTDTERAKKGVLTVDVVGGNLSWNHDALHLGNTAYYLKTEKDIQPGTAAFRRISPQGHHFGATSVDYSYEAYRWRFVGETAYAFIQNQLTPTDGIPNRWATLNALNWRPSTRYSLTLLQRYYSYNYYSFFASALSENSTVQNETGAMIRLDSSPWDGIQLTGYLDLFHHSWPRYGLQHSSNGWDTMLETECNLNRRNTLRLRYNAKCKEETEGAITHHRLRFQWNTKSVSSQWLFTTNALLHVLKGSHGEGLGHTTQYHPTTLPAQFSLSALYFHTTDYDSRIYLYEPNVNEMMYTPSFSGHGLRASGLIRYHLLHQRLTLELKYGITRYFDRSTQSSGLQTIYSPVKNDITLQARFRI